MITAAMDRNGIDPVYRAEAEAMVYHALTFDIPLDQGTVDTRTLSLRELPARDGIPFPVP